MFGFFEAIYALIQRKSAIKSIQSGTTAGAGNVTINAVNTAKAMVLSASKGSAGTVAATGTITTNNVKYYYYDEYAGGPLSTSSTYSLTSTLSGGTTNLTAKVYSAKLVNSTTIYCDGPVEWQVIEFV